MLKLIELLKAFGFLAPNHVLAGNRIEVVNLIHQGNVRTESGSSGGNPNQDRMETPCDKVNMIHSMEISAQPITQRVEVIETTNASDENKSTTCNVNKKINVLNQICKG